MDQNPVPQPRPRQTAPPDLQTQLETLLHQVWVCEAGWRFDDKLAVALSRRVPRRP